MVKIDAGLIAIGMTTVVSQSQKYSPLSPTQYKFAPIANYVAVIDDLDYHMTVSLSSVPIRVVSIQYFGRSPSTLRYLPTYKGCKHAKNEEQTKMMF
jgi:hypothetical protein